MWLENKQDTEQKFYARKVIPAKVPDLDGKKFTALDKKVDGKKVVFKQNGLWGRSFYFPVGEDIFYLVDKDEVGFKDITELGTIEKVKAKERKPTKKKSAKPAERPIFVETDGGRGESSRPKQKSDGSVRAVGIITGKSYDDAFTALKEAGRQSDRLFDLTGGLMTDTGLVAGYNAVEIVPDQNTLVEFIQANQTGTFLVETAKSLGVVKDGQYFDERYSPDEKVETVFQFNLISNATQPEPESAAQDLNEQDQATAPAKEPEPTEPEPTQPEPVEPEESATDDLVYEPAEATA
jgi:hypothetical protein